MDAYAVMDDAPSLAEKAQNFFAQSVVTETYDTLLRFMEQVGTGIPWNPRAGSGNSRDPKASPSWLAAPPLYAEP